jgi:hypothetical protein
MKQQEVFKKIGGILAELIEQYEYLKTIDGQLNELELELFLANSNFLTDHVLILSKLNAQNIAAPVIAALPVPEIKTEEPKTDIPLPVPTQNYFEPLVSVAHTENKNNTADHFDADYKGAAVNDNPVPSINLEGSNEDSYSFMHEDEPETIRHELILDEADLDGEDETYTTEYINDEAEEIEMPPVPAGPVFKTEPKPEPVNGEPKAEHIEPVTYKAPAETEKEQVKPEVLTINDRISAQMAAKVGVADQLQGQIISDLKQAINLNDKLLFVKDLFNGYSLAYSEAIEILNRFKSFAEAEQFLKNNYITKNHWDTKPETIEKFYAILKRRYA